MGKWYFVTVSEQKPLHGGKMEVGQPKDSRRSWNDNVDNRIPQMGPAAQQVWYAVQYL